MIMALILVCIHIALFTANCGVNLIYELANSIDVWQPENADVLLVITQFEQCGFTGTPGTMGRRENFGIQVYFKSS